MIILREQRFFSRLISAEAVVAAPDLQQILGCAKPLPCRIRRQVCPKAMASIQVEVTAEAKVVSKTLNVIHVAALAIFLDIAKPQQRK